MYIHIYREIYNEEQNDSRDKVLNIRTKCHEGTFSFNHILQLKLILYFPSGTHDVMEQYYTYEWDSFVADIGGYLVRILLS